MNRPREPKLRKKEHIYAASMELEMSHLLVFFEIKYWLRRKTAERMNNL